MDERETGWNDVRFTNLSAGSFAKSDAFVVQKLFDVQKRLVFDYCHWIVAMAGTWCGRLMTIVLLAGSSSAMALGAMVN